MTTDNNTTDTQPEEAAEAIWEMPDHSTSPDAVDQYFQDMEDEMEAQDAQDEADYWATVRDHS